MCTIEPSRIVRCCWRVLLKRRRDRRTPKNAGEGGIWAGGLPGWGAACCAPTVKSADFRSPHALAEIVIDVWELSLADSSVLLGRAAKAAARPPHSKKCGRA